MPASTAEPVSGTAAAAHAEGGVSGCACVRARFPHSAHRVQAPVRTLDCRGHQQQLIPQPLIPDKVPASFQPRVSPHTGSPFAPSPSSGDSAPSNNRKLLCPYRQRVGPRPRRRSAAQAELWEGSRSGGWSLKMAEAGVNWESPGRAQVSLFGGGRLEDDGGFLEEELFML